VVVVCLEVVEDSDEAVMALLEEHIVVDFADEAEVMHLTEGCRLPPAALNQGGMEARMEARMEASKEICKETGNGTEAGDAMLS
jgi:hypothetical protein